MNIVPYKPLIRVLTYDGEVYWVLKEREKEFKQQLETARFVQVQGGAMIAVRDIRRCSDEKGAYNYIPVEHRTAIMNKITAYKAKMNQEPSREQIQCWLATLIKT